MTRLELLRELQDARDGLRFDLDEESGDVGDAGSSMQAAVVAIEKALEFLTEVADHAPKQP